jgi:hypothetical protein
MKENLSTLNWSTHFQSCLFYTPTVVMVRISTAHSEQIVETCLSVHSITGTRKCFAYITSNLQTSDTKTSG